MVLLAADLSLMCRLPSASVLIGQDAVMAKPASISPLVSASHAPVALWVNISVMMPSGFSTRRHSAKIARHALLVVAPGERLGALLAGELGRVGDRLVLLVGERAGEQLRQRRARRCA